MLGNVFVCNVFFKVTPRQLLAFYLNINYIGKCTKLTAENKVKICFTPAPNFGRTRNTQRLFLYGLKPEVWGRAPGWPSPRAAGPKAGSTLIFTIRARLAWVITNKGWHIGTRWYGLYQQKWYIPFVFHGLNKPKILWVRGFSHGSFGLQETTILFCPPLIC